MRSKTAVITTIVLIGAIVASMAFASQTVRMWTFLNPSGNSPRDQALAQIIQGFEQQNPDIKVVVEQQVWDQMTPKFMAAASAGNAPDVIWVFPGLLNQAIQAGDLADLNTLFMNSWSSTQVNDIKDAYYNECNVNGKEYCIFASRNYIGILYRKDLFEQAGIDPASIKTWADLKNAATKLEAKDGSGNVTRWGFGQQFSTSQADPQMMVPYTLGEQGKLFDSNGNPMWATKAGAAALEFETSLVKDGATPRKALVSTADDLYTQFSAGKLAMMNGASVRVPKMQQEMGKTKVGFMLWPSTKAGDHAPGVASGWAPAVWSGSKVKEAAGKFLEYMTGPAADKLWVKVGGQIPIHHSTIAAMGDFFSQPSNHYLQVAAEGLTSYAWLPPVSFPVGGYRQDLNQAAQDVLTKNVAPMDALKSAEAAFKRQNQ